jgi:hypothetical protein
MKFYNDTTEEDLTALIMARQTKTVIQGIEIILPQHNYKLTRNQRLKKAQLQVREIIKLINS